MALTLTLSLTAQEQIPRFTSGVDVVQFNVNVLDKDRKPVTGLTASDFEVLVDGKPRPLSAFAAVTLPEDERPAAVAAAAASVSPDVQTNRLPPEGRLVVIVMDRSIQDGQPMQAALKAANAAIDQLGPADLGAVVFTAKGLQKYSQGFTADRVRLHAVVARAFIGAVHELPDGPSLADFISAMGGTAAAPAMSRGQLAPDELSGDCRCGVCVPDALTGIAKALSAARVRQKSIVFVGSYLAIATQSLACNPYVYPARDRLTRALDEANVTFHLLDPTGLEALSEIAEGSLSGGGVVDIPIGRSKLAPDLYRQELLAWLPDYAGGRLVMNSNRPWDRIGPIFDESRSYYVLAIARDPGEAADDRHQVKISVSRTGATVQTRHLSYGADVKPNTKGDATPAAAMAELLPRADFPLQMNLVPQFLPDGSSEVRVLLGVDSGAAGRLDVMIGAFDPFLRPVATVLKQRLDVPARAVAGSSAFQWGSVLTPPPGKVEVRAAVATEDKSRAASVIGYVDVPDLRKVDLAISGIVVKSAGTPTIRRAFAAGDTIACAFQVARSKDQQGDVSVRYLLNDDRGGTIANGSVPRDAKSTGPVAPYELALRLPAAPGRYVLTIDASDRRRSAARDVPLTVTAR